MGAPRADESEDDLFHFFDWLTRRLPWRSDTRPFPVIVLEADGTDGDPDGHLRELKRIAHEVRLPALAPDLSHGEGSEEARAIALADRLSQRTQWLLADPRFGRFRFPRSDLVRSIQKAAGPGLPPYADTADTAVARWNESAGLFPWWDEPPRLPPLWSTLGAGLAAVTAVLGGAIAAKAPSQLLLTAAAMLFVVLLMALGATSRRVWLPLMSRLGFGGRHQWFAGSTFFGVLSQGRDLAFENRLRRVFGLLRDPDAARFLLEMKTFALLEDMRDNHRRFTPSLRGFKRPGPPVVFLSGVGRENGGLALLSAMSDIRARRSEFHPLLVVASIDAAHLDELGEAALPAGSPRRRYEHWRSSLGTAQSPSAAVRLPWLLRIPVGADPAARRAEAETAFTVRRRPRWTWLWSLRGLAAAVTLCVVAATFVQVRLRATYCDVGLAFSWNGDTRQQDNADGTRECVGVSTHGVRFERGDRSLGLDGEWHSPSPANRGPGVTLADLQRRVLDENRDVETSGKPYVTLVYLGVFTTGRRQSALALSSIEELAGAYLAQRRNNGTGHPGQVGNPLKIRLLPANAGQDMSFSDATTDRILQLARTDPSVVGVVGLARNTERSQAAARRLTAAGLPVISTMNSSDQMPTLPHYYGLAATDHQEAAATRAAVKAELGDKPIEHAMLVHRSPGPSKDVYSREIADDVEAALRPRATQRVVYIGPEDIANKVRRACETPGRPYTLVYFAGRSEDLPGLMNGLTLGGCTKQRLLLLAGDDVTKSRFGTGPHEVPLPPKAVLYHTAFVHLPTLIADNADQSNGFFLLARNLLGVGGPRVRPDEPLLVDGQMAMAYDATVALGQAAQNAYDGLGLGGESARPVTGSRAVTSGSVLLELRRLHVREAATGDVDFRDDARKRNGPGNRGLTLIKVAPHKGALRTTPICGAKNGGIPAHPLPHCPR
ncbi:ABC transporter substrate-binding protein [Spirillospora sp. CA-294931]|uniref:ABC transporter substrate-binding protein n=1 Tax=Spirillospora sp. CA-294931 TaxID=3240042 RepID=UPI003D8B2BD0